jgi:hypothetical protein
MRASNFANLDPIPEEPAPAAIEDRVDERQLCTPSARAALARVVA